MRVVAAPHHDFERGTSNLGHEYLVLPVWTAHVESVMEPHHIVAPGVAGGAGGNLA